MKNGHRSRVDDGTDFDRKDLRGEPIPVRHGIAAPAWIGGVLSHHFAIAGLVLSRAWARESRPTCREYQGGQQEPPVVVRSFSRLVCVHEGDDRPARKELASGGPRILRRRTAWVIPRSGRRARWRRQTSWCSYA
jgi:hypothetical protein